MSTQPHIHLLSSLIGIIPRLCLPSIWSFHNSGVTGCLRTNDWPLTLTPSSVTGATLVQPCARSNPLNICINFSIIFFYWALPRSLPRPTLGFY